MCPESEIKGCKRCQRLNKGYACWECREGFLEQEGLCLDLSDPTLTQEPGFPTLVDFELVNEKFDIDELSIKFKIKKVNRELDLA